MEKIEFETSAGCEETSDISELCCSCASRWTNPGVPRCYTPMEQDPAILSQNSQLQMGIPQCNATGDSDIDLSLHRQLIEWSKRLYIGLGKGELSFVPSQVCLCVCEGRKQRREERVGIGRDENKGIWGSQTN